MIYVIILVVVMALVWGILAVLAARLVKEAPSPQGNHMKAYSMNFRSLLAGIATAFFAILSVPAGLTEAFGVLDSVDASQRASLLAERIDAVMTMGSPVALGGLVIGGVAFALWAIRRQKLRDISRDTA